MICSAFDGGLGTVLSVWAHPDDETYLAGAVMASAVGEACRVVCVSATAGEHGTSDPVQWPPHLLAEVRRRETAAAMSALGVTEHRFLGFVDGTLAGADRALGVRAIGELIEEVAPDTILTFGPDGMTFHPDHITVGDWTTQAWERAGRRGRLLHAAVSHEHQVAFGALYEEWGIYMTDERPVGRHRDELALRCLARGPVLDRKLAALAAMTSQTAQAIAAFDPALWRELNTEESFVDHSWLSPP